LILKQSLLMKRKRKKIRTTRKRKKFCNRNSKK
jgi:hypothetical protein